MHHGSPLRFFSVKSVARTAAAAVFILGCGGEAPAPPLDLSVERASLETMKREARTMSDDPLIHRYVGAAETIARVADEHARFGRVEPALLHMRHALAAGRVALAGASALKLETDATRCVTTAAEAHRRWLDALAMLTQAERVAGRQARAVVRDYPYEPPARGEQVTPEPALRLPEARALLDRRGEVVERATAARVVTGDLQQQWTAQLQASAGADSTVRDLRVLTAARAVQELQLRLRGETARRRCVRALASADSLADFRDQALWAMVELERGMKEATRTALDEERARAKSRQDELYDALKQFEGRFANIHQEARGTILSLSDNILFGFDKADLKQDARYDLVRVSTILQQFPEMHIYIEGHTDNVGAEDYNQKLSEKRAQAVLRFLAEQSVSLDRMDWYGYGMSRPVASNATEDGRARNRRVDLVIAEAAGE